MPRRATSCGRCTSRSRQTGRVRRGEIGVRAQTMTPVLAAGLDWRAIRASSWPTSCRAAPRARAGTPAGDIVLALDGKPMENGRQFQVDLYRRRVGDVVTLEVLRDGATCASRSPWPSGATPGASWPARRSARPPGAAARHPWRDAGPGRLACAAVASQPLGLVVLSTAGAAVRKCMRAHGPKLSRGCVNALVAAGEVSKKEVGRRSSR